MFMPRQSTFRQPGRRSRRTSLLGRTRRKDRGASAVEFALVSPLVFTLLFGAIDYGLYFADAMTVQQGAADAARNATLSVGGTAANWPGDASCLPGLAMSGAGNDLAKVACSLSTSVQPIGGGMLVVKAEVVTPDGTPTTSWAQPQPAPGLRHGQAHAPSCRSSRCPAAGSSPRRSTCRSSPATRCWRSTP